ncbi:MAG: TVP38/TMEM64 family protein [Pseudomonadota bacterium]
MSNNVTMAAAANDLEPGTAEAAGSEKKSMIKRFLPLVMIVAAIGTAWGLGLQNYISLDALKENREALQAFVSDYGILAALAFMVLYAVTTALSLPTGLVMTLAGGFMFGTWLGGATVVLGATIGATIIFLVAKTSLGEALHAKAGPFLKKLEAGFREGEVSYLFIIRLVPVVPFFIANIAPAFLGVKTRNYIVTTLFGIMPGTFVYAGVGNGLGAALDKGEDLNLGIIFEPQVLGPLIGLALLALLPVVVKKLRKTKLDTEDAS